MPFYPQETTKKFNTGLSRIVKKWIDKYAESGVFSLESQKRGRKAIMNANSKIK